MTKVVYFDCNAGISGNMFVGAMLDLGLPQELLMAELKKLPIPLPPIDVIRTNRNGLSAVYFDVHAPHEHHHRHLSEILDMIHGTDLSETVKRSAEACFRYLAEAEAKVHGVSVEDIHFHEVGAIDAIIDIVSAAIAMEWLDADVVAVSPIRLGYGTIQCAHGKIPLPAPAVVELLKGFQTFGGELEGEWTTPTGAAIIKTFVNNTSLCSLPLMTVENNGFGAGTAERAIPNVFRVMVGFKESETGKEQMMMVETHIDDMNPEIYGYIGERLLEAGAKDFYYTPVYMKKNRPGILISVLVEMQNVAAIEGILLEETTTLGIRRYPVERSILKRGEILTDIEGCPVRVKTAYCDSGYVKYAPEYEDCRKAAIQLQRPLREIYDLAHILAKKTRQNERKGPDDME